MRSLRTSMYSQLPGAGRLLVDTDFWCLAPTKPKGQDTPDVNAGSDPGEDDRVWANGEACHRLASSMGRPFQAVFVPQLEANNGGDPLG